MHVNRALSKQLHEYNVSKSRPLKPNQLAVGFISHSEVKELLSARLFHPSSTEEAPTVDRPDLPGESVKTSTETTAFENPKMLP